MAVGAVAGGADVRVTGRRVVTISDSMILAIVYAIMTALFGTTSTQGGGISATLSGLPFVIYLLTVVAYYTGLEGATSQTIRKMLLGIQVIREDSGSSPGMGKALIRTLLRVIDGFLVYLAGFIIVLISGKNQRLGTWRQGPS